MLLLLLLLTTSQTLIHATHLHLIQLIIWAEFPHARGKFDFLALLPSWLLHVADVLFALATNFDFLRVGAHFDRSSDKIDVPVSCE